MVTLMVTLTLSYDSNYNKNIIQFHSLENNSLAKKDGKITLSVYLVLPA